MLSVTPKDTIEISWSTPLTDGCLPLLGYTIERDGQIVEASLDPSLHTYTDSIGASDIGIVHTYRVRAFNNARLNSDQPNTGFSIWSEPLTIKVGLKPKAPTNLHQTRIISETEIEIEWNSGGNYLNDLAEEILVNPPTFAYRVYLDDGEGNEPDLVYDTGASALTTVVVVKDLLVGHTY